MRPRRADLGAVVTEGSHRLLPAAVRWRQDDLVRELEHIGVTLLLGGEERDGVAAERVLEGAPAGVASEVEHAGSRASTAASARAV